MTQKRAVFVLLASALVGVLAVVAALRLLMPSDPAVSTAPTAIAPSGFVVAAGVDLKAGSSLTQDQLVRVPWYSVELPVGSMSNPSALAGRVTARDLKKGEVIFEGLLALPAQDRSLSDAVRPGMRAMSVAVSDVSDVAGFVMPGNQVDVLLRVGDAEAPGFSRLILERLPVLAVGQERHAQDPATPRLVKTVTLEVTPGQAERLDLARSLGTISLILRHPADDQAVSSSGAQQGDVRPAASIIEVIRGTDRVLQPGS